MLDALQSNRAYLLEKVFLCCCLLVLAPMSGIAQTPEGVVPSLRNPTTRSDSTTERCGCTRSSFQGEGNLVA